MPVNSVEQNVVIVARQWRTASISETWLIRNNFATEEQFNGPKISTDAISHFSTSRFNLLVTPDKFICSRRELQIDVPDFGTLVQEMIRSLPDPGITAVGMNQLFNVRPNDAQPIVDWSRELFEPGDTRLSRAVRPPVGGDQCSWGAFAVRQFQWGGMLRVQVLPQFPSNTALNNPTHLLADFNYNFPLATVDDAAAAIGHFRDVVDHSNQVVQSLQ